MNYGEDFTVVPWRVGWRYGHGKRKNVNGKRGKDKKPRIMHPNSLKNLLSHQSNGVMKK